MVHHKSFLPRINVSTIGAMVIGTLTALPARADDPLVQIKQTIERDRNKACPNSGILSYDTKLEAVAQDFARSENQSKISPPPPGYKRLVPYLGAGDPEAQAINRTYQHGAGQTIGTCGEFAYGVGFIRHENRSVDVVTMVFGELSPPRHPASIRLKPGLGSFYISGIGFSQNTVVSIAYQYVNGGISTHADQATTLQVDSSGNFATIVSVSTMISHGRLDVEAKDTGGLSTTKSIQFLKYQVRARRRRTL